MLRYSEASGFDNARQDASEYLSMTAFDVLAISFMLSFYGLVYCSGKRLGKSFPNHFCLIGL